MQHLLCQQVEIENLSKSGANRKALESWSDPFTKSSTCKVMNLKYYEFAKLQAKLLTQETQNLHKAMDEGVI